MHLKTGVVAIIIAAAAGAAAGRATASHGASGVALGEPAATRPGATLASSGGPADVATARGAETFASGAGGSRTAPRIGSGDRSGIATAARAVVYVAGAVARPGVYTLHASARADDAVRAAGGATAQADLVAINLAALVEDGQEIAVPVRGAADAGAAGGAGSAARASTKHPRRHSGKRGHHRKRRSPSAAATDTADAPTEMVDVNAADEATLETLPGIGPSLAERIVAFRDLNGPFASSDELLDVGGMTAGKVDAISPYVTFP